MAEMRKPFQGVGNIIRFNWHFYVMAVGIIMLIFILNNSFQNDFKLITNFILTFILLSVFTSLFISWYVYDYSGLYEFDWMNQFQNAEKVLNINAGFDETSQIIQNKFPGSGLTVFDFYDKRKHTEISIRRARKAYPPFPGTIHVKTDLLPSENERFDLIFNLLSAHEIRNDEERITFFKEQNRILKLNGKIAVTEHIRDFPNFLAYTIGFFHFHSKRTWHKTFQKAGFQIEKEIRTTPFISTFILIKNGNSS